MKTRLSYLIGIALVTVVAFQFYWLNENFTREKSALEIKAGNLFKKAVRDLQIKKFDLAGIIKDTTFSDGNAKVLIKHTSESGLQADSSFHKEMVLTTINAIENKRSTLIMHRATDEKNILITVKSRPKAVIVAAADSANFKHGLPPGPFVDEIIKLNLLQNPLNIADIDSACRIEFEKNNVLIPFTVIKIDSLVANPTNFDVSQNLAKPVTFRLQLDETGRYLIKKLFLPFLFSFGLITLTGFVFALLYQNIRKQERLAQQNENFISNITHELKTPVSTVSAAIEALQNFNATADTRKTQEYLGLAQDELHRLNLLIEKALHFSKFRQSPFDMVPEKLDLRTITETVVNAFKPLAEKTNAQIAIESSGDLNFCAERMHIVGAISNLLDNALKYTQKEPHIRIKLWSDAYSVHFSIADNGIGIEPAYKSKVFEKFFRVPQGDVHNVKGHGLGLSYVSEVIKLHHGTIQIDSMPTQGTTVYFSLPRQLNG